MLKIISSKDKKALDRLLARRAQRLNQAEAVVRPILEAVRKRGDRALLQYARKFDGLQAKTVRVPVADLTRAAQDLKKDFRAAVDMASKQIRRFAELQMPRPWVRNAGNGVTLGQIVQIGRAHV